jgi:hypothetical protein
MADQESFFLTYFSFQAIECTLAGIKFPGGDILSEEVTDVVYEFADNSRGLYVKVCHVYSNQPQCAKLTVLLDSLALKMEALCFPEKLVTVY